MAGTSALAGRRSVGEGAAASIGEHRSDRKRRAEGGERDSRNERADPETMGLEHRATPLTFIRPDARFRYRRTW